MAKYHLFYMEIKAKLAWQHKESTL
jgi:hypothetical protein